MNYIKITNRIRTKYFINIFLFIGFALVVTKLENYFYDTEDYTYNPIPVNNELVINKHSNEELISTHYCDEHESKSTNVEDTNHIYSNKLTIIGHNSLINSQFKTVELNQLSHIYFISILQKNNIWHKSSKEEPGILS